MQAQRDPFEDPTLIPRYKKIRNLGKGSFGNVVLAVDLENNNKAVAIKFMNRGVEITQYVERELEQHSMLWHPHIIKFRELFLTPHHLGIVLEYADGGDMYDYVVSRRRLSENRARWIFQQLIVAVDYLHRMGVASRDIKLENTLVAGNPDKPLIKLCDLGYAKHVDLHSTPNSTVGTPAYLAPEVIKDKTYDARVADIWSCGVLLYVMLVGQYPFERPEDRALPPAQKQQTMITRILEANYALPPGLSSECVDLIRMMLVADPAKRVTIPMIQAHPWYQAYLPPGVTRMNQDLRPHESAQNQQEIRRLVREAMKLPADAGGLNADAYDDMMDLLM